MERKLIGQRTKVRAGPPLRAGLSSRVWVALAILLVGTLAACATSGVRDACLTLEASSALNLYDGEPHVTAVYLYPLESRLGFEQATVTELLSERSVAGMVGSRLQLTIVPGEAREVRESLPRTASHLGLVADFWRGTSNERRAKLIVDSRCGLWAPEVELTQDGIAEN